MSEDTLSLSNDFDVMQAGSKQTDALINNFHDCLKKIDEMGDYVDITPYLSGLNAIIDKLPEKEKLVSETIPNKFNNSNANEQNIRESFEKLVYSSVNLD